MTDADMHWSWVLFLCFRGCSLWWSVTWFFVRIVSQDIFNIAFQNGAEHIDGVGTDVDIGPESGKLPGTNTMVFYQLIL